MTQHDIIFRQPEYLDAPKSLLHDFGFTPTSRPTIVPPDFQSDVVSIPSSDNSYDYSSEILGRPVFGERKGSIECIAQFNDMTTWIERYPYMASWLNGHNVYMTLEDDPAFYYEGYVTLPAWKSDPYWNTVTINYVLKPYKFPLYSHDTENSLFGDIEWVNRSKTYNIGGGPWSAAQSGVAMTFPTVSVYAPSALEVHCASGSNISIYIDGNRYDVGGGTTYLLGSHLRPIGQVVELYGSGTIDRMYEREGQL